LSKGWHAVSMSATEGNKFPTEELSKKGMQATFIEARDEDLVEFEEDHDHVVSAERDLFINSENLDEFRNNVLMKLTLDSSNGISCYSNLLISSTFGGYRTHQKDEDIAMFRLKYHLVPLRYDFHIQKLRVCTRFFFFFFRLALNCVIECPYTY
jgi:hypothetical protein